MPSERILLVCGSRKWTDIDMIHRTIIRCFPRSLPDLLIHGDNGYDGNGLALWGQPDHLAVRGADKLAGRVADQLGIPKRVFTPDWQGRGEAAGPLRNDYMLLARPTHVFAFHDDIQHSAGTKDMVLKASLSGAWVRVFSHRKAGD